MNKTPRPTQEYLVNKCLCKNTMVDGSFHLISCPSVPTMIIDLPLSVNGKWDDSLIPRLAPSSNSISIWEHEN